MLDAQLALSQWAVASILSSLSLSAKGANEAYSMTLRGDRGAITLDAMWSGNSRIRFVPEGGETGQGVSQELFPWRVPFVVRHGVSHPHVCNWAAGVEVLARSLEDQAKDTSHFAFTGERARHVVEVLEKAEASAAKGGGRERIVSTFAWPLPLLPVHCMGPSRALLSKTFESESSRRADGETFVQASPIAFGTMRLAQAQEPMTLLDAVWNMGCNVFDLGHVYGTQVECLFGKVDGIADRCIQW